MQTWDGCTVPQTGSDQKNQDISLGLIRGVDCVGHSGVVLSGCTVAADRTAEEKIRQLRELGDPMAAEAQSS